MENTVLLIFNLVAIYIVIGLVFSIAFLWKGLSKVDKSTVGTGVIFRIMLLPGLLIFWPSFLIKWIKNK